MQPPAASVAPPGTVRPGAAEAKAAGRDITKELDALLSEKAEVETVKEVASPVLKPTFRADAPVFVPQAALLKASSPQKGLRAEAPAFAPPRGVLSPGMGCMPDPNITGTMRQIEELDAQLSGSLLPEPWPQQIRRNPARAAPSVPGQISRNPHHVLPQGAFPAPGQPQLNSFVVNAAAASDQAGVRLFEEQWSAEVVPDALKDLWVAPGPMANNPALAQPLAQHNSAHNVFATAPPKSPPTYAQAPPLYPYESPVLNASHPGLSLKALLTPSTAVSDSPGYLSSPLQQYSVPLAPIPPPPRAPLPASTDHIFSMRELLLKFRTSMGTVASPWELKLRYNLVDEEELLPQHDGSIIPSSPSHNAGQTLLAFARGEASMSEVVGKKKGAELLSMINTADDDTKITAATGNENVARLLGLNMSPVQKKKEIVKEPVHGKDYDWDRSNSLWHGANEANSWGDSRSKGGQTQSNWSPSGSWGGKGKNNWEANPWSYTANWQNDWRSH